MADDDLCQRGGGQRAFADAYQHTLIAVDDLLGGFGTQASAQQAVGASGHGATLHIAQHRRAELVPLQ